MAFNLQNLITKNSIAKPFLKWAGGKTQLIPQIENYLPLDIKGGKRITYIEPFIGSGAIFFWFIQRFNVKEAVISDLNADLINVYETIKSIPETLITNLDAIESDYYALDDEEKKRHFFYNIRDLFNFKTGNKVISAAYFIFLNRTCFNGLYRVNSKNLFNVPFGKYARPKISDHINILAVSKLLQNVTILNGDYTETLKYADKNSFFYFDPPYKPISKTASFNAYAKGQFGDEEQLRLAAFTELLTQQQHLWLLSNSDPKNINPSDVFFDDLYAKPANTILRVGAKRMINANALKRGEINEVLIMNY